MMTTNGRLAGRRALVTGASRGIGEAIARAFAVAGAHVWLTSRNAEQLKRIATEIVEAGGAAEAIPCDLQDRDGVVRLAAAVEPIDILVNNAMAVEKYVPVLVNDEQHWAEVWEVGFWSPLALMRSLVPGMVQRRQGVVLNISSAVAQRLPPMAGAYATCKVALDALTRITAMEVGASGVRCNGIAPGPINTRLAHDMTAEDIGPHIASMLPLARWGEPAELAALALFLASDEASFITGQVVSCDGGMLAGDHRLMAAVGSQAVTGA